MTVDTARLFPELASYLERVCSDIDVIPPERGVLLDSLAHFVGNRLTHGVPAHAVFVCTHNSRRSQLAQVWAQTAAHLNGLDGFAAFSGGTEVTTCNPRTVAALERAGFRVDITADGENPVYRVRFGPTAPAIECFSKLYHQPPNPSSGYCAVMTCASADAGCPVVLGADERLPIRYDDPKASDGTDREIATYDERCRQVAGEMLYAFSVAAAR